MLQAFATDGSQLKAECPDFASAKRQMITWLTAGWRVDCAEVVDAQGDVTHYYEKGRWHVD